jgi:hypothetical protein
VREYNRPIGLGKRLEEEQQEQEEEQLLFCGEEEEQRQGLRAPTTLAQKSKSKGKSVTPGSYGNSLVVTKPFLFLEPSRANLMKYFKDNEDSMRAIGGSLGKEGDSTLDVTPRGEDDCADDGAANDEDDTQPGTPFTDISFITSLSTEEASARDRKMDAQVRRNAMVFHGAYFAINSVLTAYPELDPEKNNAEIKHIRKTVLKWHRDLQHKFLFKHFLPWCKEFLVDNERVAELCQEDLTLPENEEIARELQVALSSQLNKRTFEAVWKTIASHIDYEATFKDHSALPYFFLEVIFFTLAPMMFKLIAKEQELNKDRSKQDVQALDLNYRQTIRETYRALAFEERFEFVEREIFIWNPLPIKRRRVKAVDNTLNKVVWFNKRAPPPPLNFVPRPASELSSVHLTATTTATAQSTQAHGHELSSRLPHTRYGHTGYGGSQSGSASDRGIEHGRGSSTGGYQCELDRAFEIEIDDPLGEYGS